ncbi:MAG: hypothetical protein H6Q90_7166 [Deltaproteobacteria bacterium]|nr:hypothetical protein [Deltaproteobacteria bacterium]
MHLAWTQCLLASTGDESLSRHPLARTPPAEETHVTGTERERTGGSPGGQREWERGWADLGELGREPPRRRVV